METTTTIKFQSLQFDNSRTYLTAALFVIGNIIMPQLFHLVPQGGVTWLPIYFFTLIGAYKYGWRVGLLTALASPVINSLLFGMPPVAALPAIISSRDCLPSSPDMRLQDSAKQAYGCLRPSSLPINSPGPLPSGC